MIIFSSGLLLILLLLLVLLLLLLLLLLLRKMFLRDQSEPVNVGHGVILDREPTSQLDSKDPPISNSFNVTLKPSSLSF